MNANDIVAALALEQHVEGGAFTRTFCSTHCGPNAEGLQRPFMTSIYYLMTRSNNLSYFAINKSDLILYYHMGAPLKVIFIHADGWIEEQILGTDLAAGQRPQCICPAGVPKAYQLDGDYCLISEAVSPGFDYGDMSMPNKETLMQSQKLSLAQITPYLDLIAK